MTASRAPMLGWVVAALVAGLIAAPIGAGLWETVAPAFGHLPAIGAAGLSLEPWRVLVAQPDLMGSVVLTVAIGVGSTLVSLALALAWWAARGHLAPAGWHGAAIAPVLATPHAAMAVGLACLIAPSGWLVRLVSPWATGWTLPPDWPTVHDRHGLAVILVLVLKETAFFLLVVRASLAQIDTRSLHAVGASLGYGPAARFWRLIAPQIYRQIRLPVFIVLAYGLSVIDVVLLIGPSHPPTLAVMALRWFQAPDLALRLPGAAAAVALTGLVGASILGWAAAERAVAWVGRRIVARGRRTGLDGGLTHALASVVPVLIAATGLGIAVLLLWSFAWRWPFPAAWPESLTLAHWVRTQAAWREPFAATLVIGLASTLVGVALAVATLEAADRGRLSARARSLIAGWSALPLIVPSIAFVHGLSIAALRSGLDHPALLVAWGHLLFVYPYALLTLADAWRALDPRLARVAAALGASPTRTLFAVKLPLLAPALAITAAIGFSVSVAQYAATLLLGAGRIATVTTEAIAITSGADRRTIAVYAVLQAVLPWAAFALALSAPLWLARWRAHRFGAAA